MKFIEPLGQVGRKKRYYQYTAIDDCTRLRVLRAYPNHDQQTAIRFIDHVLSKLPFKVEKVQTDNGKEFGQIFHWHLLDKGIGHVYIKPATPRLNGKVERSHRIDSEEFYRLLEGEAIDDVNLFNDKLQEWEATTTTIDHTEPSQEAPPTRASNRKLKTYCHKPPSVAQCGDNGFMTRFAIDAETAIRLVREGIAVLEARCQRATGSDASSSDSSLLRG